MLDKSLTSTFLEEKLLRGCYPRIRGFPPRPSEACVGLRPM
jgi:hypothetical protein